MNPILSNELPSRLIFKNKTIYGTELLNDEENVCHKVDVIFPSSRRESINIPRIGLCAAVPGQLLPQNPQNPRKSQRPQHGLLVEQLLHPPPGELLGLVLVAVL